MKDNRKTILYSISTFFIGIVLSLAVIYNFPSIFSKTIVKEEKNVTITDTGLSESVEKVYNKVALISNYSMGKLSATGSGFIYKIDGNDTYIVTNHHVVDGGTTFKVTYSDETTLDATLVGSDEYTDIAVLKVKTIDGLDAVELSDSNNIKAGDTVFALGSPLDSAYSFTVTRGIISGKERLVEITSNNSNILLKVIQTDAAVNSGNSGGPLCNANGQVIGVVNAKLSGSGIEGIGFAIPIDTAIENADEIIGGNEKEYPYIGVSIVSVSDAKNDFRYYSYVKSLDIEEGILVLDVEKNSPAYNKLKKGDVITKINDSETNNAAYFRYELYKYNINDEITITYIRDGKVESTKIKLSKKNSNIKVSFKANIILLNCEKEIKYFSNPLKEVVK